MTRKWTKLTLSLFIFTIMSTLSLTSQADEASDIKYRKTVMKAIGGTMGSMGAIVKGKAPQKHAASLAHAMWRLSVTIKDVFPEGSDFGETRAKPEIWEKKAEFNAAVKSFEAASFAISKISHSGDSAAFTVAFKSLGKTCGGCHKPFREKKK